MSPSGQVRQRVVAGVEVWCRVTVLEPAGAQLASWVVGGPGAPDLRVVDALARWQRAAGQLGGVIVLREVSAQMAELLDLVGLRREVVRQAEGGEQLGGSKERVEPRDPLT